MDITAPSFSLSSSSKALRVIPISDFYPVLQLTASGTYTYYGVTFGSGPGAGLNPPGVLHFGTSGTYIWINIDPYLINSSSNITFGMVCSNSSGSSTIKAGLYAISSTGSGTSMSLVGESTETVSGTLREEVGFSSISTTITRDNMYYLKISKDSGTSTTYIYRVSIVESYNNDIETALNVF